MNDAECFDKAFIFLLFMMIYELLEVSAYRYVVAVKY